MKYNWPDRFKLVLVNTLLNLIIGTAIAIFMMSQDVCKKYFNTLSQLFGAGIFLSFLLTLPIFLKKWNELRSQEDAGELPDLEDPRNVKPFQILFIILCIVLLVTSYALSQLYSKLAGSLCFVAVIIIGGIERFYIKKREIKLGSVQDN